MTNVSVSTLLKKINVTYSIDSLERMAPGGHHKGETVYIVTNVIIGIVAALHIYFLVLEMFLWDKPLGLRTFRNSPEKAETTKVLAANQGLYNGFLAAGLIWGLLMGMGAGGFHHESFHIKIFFLTCVIVAGAYGAYSVSRRIFYIQAAPALLALILLHL